MCENNKSNTTFEFTPLNRNERLKVLQSLPRHFDELLSDELVGKTSKLSDASIYHNYTERTGNKKRRYRQHKAQTVKYKSIK